MQFELVLQQLAQLDPTPFVLAIVLGPLAEPALRQSLIGSHGDMTIFFTRPISGTIMAIALLLILLPLIKILIDRIKRA